jgi:hypothetical protein
MHGFGHNITARICMTQCMACGEHILCSVSCIGYSTYTKQCPLLPLAADVLVIPPFKFAEWFYVDFFSHIVI